MQVLRPVLLRRAQRVILEGRTARLARSGLVYSWRAQHDHHGPHKEYFQTPGQMPVPDSTPYTHGQTYIPKIQNVTPPSRVGGGGSLLTSFSRSVFWAALFASLGVTAGTALITWEYLQPPFEPGSPAEQELYEEILDAMELHPLVDSLRQANWIEENYYATHGGIENKGLHLVAEKLEGTQGVTMKTFKHPTQEFTIMVCFLGFGLEGWPDTIHGGMIVTLIEEGIQRQIHNFYKKYGSRDHQMISIDFKRRMRPGEIYAIIIPPAQLEPDPGPNMMHLQLAPMVVRIEAPPRITPELLTIELPSIDELHALANVEVRLVQFKNEEDTAEREGGGSVRKD
ncbi:uncharacterized protein Z519_02274 [Cladophialophora bantiana CBS 173.52]|uniref:Thioesterase domain-containing protein n=1 Tax=Cladophialophora bantiana (strain ATCC 10958 / CBS 173.52 / CDC B-1940 / NIH 8579) TaxID=1442370 RepID=A0A0D2HTY0_CLAB1|nr:uncharacterized protein Z519_02274 [Cladophialophora bantiana CBS 173.52]KIW96883.1 hypothetical protein Z519_02274 [Cladophialophora bantiana CBS 173.52]